MHNLTDLSECIAILLYLKNQGAIGAGEIHCRQ